jgi:hypothetical protein
MKQSSSDAIARLTAADPARHAVPDDSERARLWRVIAATPGGAQQAKRRAHKRLPHKRLLYVTLALPAALILAVGVLAAGGAFSAGRPLPGGGVAGRAALLVPLTSPYPGEMPWGEHVLSTSGPGSGLQSGPG